MSDERLTFRHVVRLGTQSDFRQGDFTVSLSLGDLVLTETIDYGWCLALRHCGETVPIKPIRTLTQLRALLCALNGPEDKRLND